MGRYEIEFLFVACTRKEVLAFPGLHFTSRRCLLQFPIIQQVGGVRGMPSICKCMMKVRMWWAVQRRTSEVVGSCRGGAPSCPTAGCPMSFISSSLTSGLMASYGFPPLRFSSSRESVGEDRAGSLKASICMPAHEGTPGPVTPKAVIWPVLTTVLEPQNSIVRRMPDSSVSRSSTTCTRLGPQLAHRSTYKSLGICW